MTTRRVFIQVTAGSPEPDQSPPRPVWVNPDLVESFTTPPDDCTWGKCALFFTGSSDPLVIEETVEQFIASLTRLLH
jgi:hypothetical protein